MVYYPRRSFDLWGARYFVLPATPDLASRERGMASFLDQTELIYPSPEVLYRRRDNERESWGLQHDWHLRRNTAAYPRAWVVHSALLRPPSSDAETRARMIRALTYMNDRFWSEGDRPVVDLRQTALIETEDKDALKPFLSPAAAGRSEPVEVVKYEPHRVELSATLEQPGLIILADTYYPGWWLTIDGEPAPIYRANRMMRGAVVPAGRHTLVYVYRPASFYIGAVISVIGLCALLACGWRAFGRRPALPPAAALGMP
jgi:hypothetical protein